MTFDGLTPPYGTIICDPPWAFATNQRLAGRGRRAAGPGRSYSTLTVDALARMPVGDLAAEQAHLWLWVPSSILAAGDQAPLFKAWGFRPITTVTWCKRGQPGLGRYVRSTTEHVVLAVRGWGTVPELAAPTSWWTWQRGAHSEKPAAFGDLVEMVSPPRYLELFARQQRLSNEWDSWGWGYETGASA